MNLIVYETRNSVNVYLLYKHLFHNQNAFCTLVRLYYSIVIESNDAFVSKRNAKLITYSFPSFVDMCQQPTNK